MHRYILKPILNSPHFKQSIIHDKKFITYNLFWQALFIILYAMYSNMYVYCILYIYVEFLIFHKCFLLHDM